MVASNKKLGDFEIIELTIVNSISKRKYDISNQVINISINESIFTPFMSGSITILDTLGIDTALPINGQEYIQLELKTPALDISIKNFFYVTKIENKKLNSNRQYSYDLVIVSTEFLSNVNTRIAQSVAGTTATIVPELFYNLKTDKQLNFEDSANELRYVSNYWTFHENMKYVCTHAINDFAGVCYTFFENRDGFNFISLERIIKTFLENENKPFMKWVSSDKMTYSVGGNHSSIDTEYQSVLSTVVLNSHDYLKNSKTGAYGSMLFGYDATNQNLIFNVYDSSITYKNTIQLNEYNCIPQEMPILPDSCMMLKSYMLNTYNDVFDTTNISWLQHRLARMAIFNMNKILIKVWGKTDYTVGKVIRYEHFERSPTKQGTHESEILNKFISGNYILAEIAHNFNFDKHEHTCDIQLIKDSYITDLHKKED